MAMTDVPETSEMGDRHMPVGLNSLPTELLMDICEILANTHATSLVAFARTSRRYYHVSQSMLVRTVRIDDDGSDADVTQSITKCLQRLRRDCVTDRVQRLVLGTKTDDRSAMSRVRCADISTVLSVDEHLGYETGIMKNCGCCELGWQYCRGLEQYSRWHAYKTETRWDAVNGLIKEFPRLMHLVFACNGQFPRRLLRTLTAHHPTSKVHLYKFNLWSGSGGRTISQLCHEEHEIITSPLIHTINDSRLHCWRNLDGRSEAVENLVRGLTPNLKVFRGGSDSRLRFLYKYGWADLGARASQANVPTGTQNIASSAQIGSLEYLEFHSPRNSAFKPLRGYTDFSSLRALKIVSHGVDSLSELAELLEGINIGRLDSLCFVNRHDYPKDPTDKNLEWVLDLLGNLRCLELNWCYMPSVAKIASPTLRKLHLVGSRTRTTFQGLSRPELVQLGKNCPQLEDLRVPILRRKGSAEEVACYATLGRFYPRLRYLNLCLLAEAPRGDYPHNGPFRRYGGNLDIDFLINMAVDEKLAASIFDVISCARSQVPGKLLLETLTVGPRSVNSQQEWKPLETLISRTWHIQRDVRDDRRDQLSLTEREIPKGCSGYPNPERYVLQNHKWRHQWLLYQEIWGNTCPKPNFVQLTGRGHGVVWPLLKGWHSFPLDVDGFKRAEEDET